MLQVYESTGVFGVVFLTMTPILSVIYLWHNILLPSLLKKFYSKYHGQNYSKNSSDVNSVKKSSFFKKWFK